MGTRGMFAMALFVAIFRESQPRKYSKFPAIVSKRVSDIGRYIMPTDEEVYDSFAKARGFAPSVIPLPHGARVSWIGDKQASKILLYFHGDYEG